MRRMFPSMAVTFYLRRSQAFRYTMPKPKNRMVHTANTKSIMTGSLDVF